MDPISGYRHFGEMLKPRQKLGRAGGCGTERAPAIILPGVSQMLPTG